MKRIALSAPPAWIADQWPDAVMITNRSGVIEYVNPAFEALRDGSKFDPRSRFKP